MHLSNLFLISAAVAPALGQLWFPDTVAENDRPECLACLNTAVNSTCNGEASSGFEDCMCEGDGRAKFQDECFTTCCGATSFCLGQTYTEWWLQCVDNHPLYTCHDASKIRTPQLLGEHCSSEEITAASEQFTATKIPVVCTRDPDDDLDLQNFNRGCEVYVDAPTGGAAVLGLNLVFGLAIGLVAFVRYI